MSYYHLFHYALIYYLFFPLYPSIFISICQKFKEPKGHLFILSDQESVFIHFYYLSKCLIFLSNVYLLVFIYFFIHSFIFICVLTKIKKWCKKRLGAGAITRNDSSQSRSGMPAYLRTGNTGNNNALKLVPASRQRTGRDFKRQSQIVWGTF